MSDRTDLIVIGGGIIGASVAYAASCAGITTRLIERGRIGMAGATRASGGIVRVYHDDPVLSDRTARSMSVLDAWPGFELTRTGFLGLEPAVRAPAARAEVERLRKAYGLELQILSVAELNERFPQLNTQGVGLGIFEPSAGFVDPVACASALAQAARSRGALCLEGVAVERLRVVSEALVEVDTSLGTVTAAQVVIAAGAGSKAFLPASGNAFELRSKGICARQLVSSADAGLACAFADHSTGLYGRPLGPNRFLIGLPTNDWDVSPELNAPLRMDAAFTKPLLERFPKLASAVYEGGRYGVDAYTASGQGVVRPCAGASNVIVASGFSGSGVMTAPALAELALEALRGD